MESLVIFTSLTRIATCSEGVHGKCHRFVSLLGEGTETHRTCNEVLHDFLDRFYLVDRDRVLAESEEVADEDGLLFVVDKLGVFLKQLIVALAGGKLQRGDGLWVPGMLDAVLTIVELSHAGQEVEFLGGEGLVVQMDGVAGYRFETYAADGAYLCAEIVL